MARRKLKTAKAKRGRTARAKGIKFENEMIAHFRANLEGWTIPDRGLQCRGGRELPDVSLTAPGRFVHDSKGVTCGWAQAYHVETKVGQAPNLRHALAQANRDRNPHAVAIAICRWNGKNQNDPAETLCCLALEDLIDLLREAHS